MKHSHLSLYCDTILFVEKKYNIYTGASAYSAVIQATTLPSKVTVTKFVAFCFIFLYDVIIACYIMRIGSSLDSVSWLPLQYYFNLINKINTVCDHIKL